MGLGFNSIKFLLWAKNLGVDFNRTATLGHQGFSCSPRMFRQALREFSLPASNEEIDRCYQKGPCEPLFADNFFQFLGAKEALSVDYSDFEGASLLHDLNAPFPESLRGGFDAVVDGGTLEHIFDFPAALRNCLELLSVGGHFITTDVPANSLMGHGFYQFSPELFFRVFNAENGFNLRKMVLYEAERKDAAFYEVSDPAVVGKRVELASRGQVMIALLAQRTALLPILAHAPQQSDYVAVWKSPPPKLDRSTWFGRLRVALNPYWPLGLRLWKQNLIYHRQRGPRGLNNTGVYRKLGRKEISRERVSNQTSLPAGALNGQDRKASG
jgi:SAM-dependent methyltransferase